MIEQKKKTGRRVKYKKARGHGGHHGGSWKVAYADFVTAMMALFLVLWLVSQGDHKLKAAIANYFRTPGAFDTARGNIMGQGESGEMKLDTLMATRDDEKALYSTAALLRKKLSQVNRDQIKIDITEDGLHIQILDKADQVSFQSGSAELAENTRNILKEIATTICGLPNRIDIGGHTDSYTFPNAEYTNWELSADRANAARRALETDCVKPESIRRIVGYGDTKPLVLDDPYAPANRRISIMLLWQKSVVEDKKAVDALSEDKSPKTNTQIEAEHSKSDDEIEAESSKTDSKNEEKMNKKGEDKISKSEDKTSKSGARTEAKPLKSSASPASKPVKSGARIENKPVKSSPHAREKSPPVEEVRQRRVRPQEADGN